MLEENCSIEVFATELRRRIQEGKGDAQANSSPLSHESLRNEALIAESLARQEGLWIEFPDIFNLGTPFPSGVENDVYLNSNGNLIYKVNNLMTSKSILSLLDRLLIHNSIFPQTSYRLKGMTGFGNGSVYPVLCQDFIPNEREATPIEIDTYMAALSFTKLGEATYENGDVVISDLHPRNVLRDADGDFFVIDAEFKVK